MKRSLLATVLLLAANAAAAEWSSVRIGYTAPAMVDYVDQLDLQAAPATDEPHFIRYTPTLGPPDFSAIAGAAEAVASARQPGDVKLVGGVLPLSFHRPCTWFPCPLPCLLDTALDTDMDLPFASIAYEGRCGNESPVAEAVRLPVDGEKKARASVVVSIGPMMSRFTADTAVQLYKHAAGSVDVKPFVGYSHGMALVGYNHDLSYGSVTWRKEIAVNSNLAETRWSYGADDDKLPPNPLPYPPFPPKL